MYEQFFGLSENPFSLTPDPRFIYSSRSHDEALAHLRYWVEHREGFAMITGEVGTGKTTALFRLIDGMARQFEIAFITNSTLTPVELLEDICRKFRIDLPADVTKPVLLQKLEAALLRLREVEHGAILIIDEAQNFDHALLEEVRLLSNITRPGGPPLLQIALVGQPELERKLSLPDLRQLKQRIGVHYRIEPLSEPETTHYIHHRVQVAGGYPRVLFPAETVKVLHQKTHGLPREINQVASQSLLGAYVEDSTTVRPDHVHSAIKEMNFRSVLDGAPLTVAPQGPTGSAGSVAPTVDISPERGSAISRGGRDTAPAPTPSAPRAPIPSITPVTPVTQPRRPEPVPVTVPIPAAESPAPAGTVPGPQPRTPRAGNVERKFEPVARVGAAPVQYATEKKGPGRLIFLVGSVIIVALAAYLAFAPRDPMRDDLRDMSSEATIPKVPENPLTGKPAGDIDPADGLPNPVGMESQAAGTGSTPSSGAGTAPAAGTPPPQAAPREADASPGEPNTAAVDNPAAATPAVPAPATTAPAAVTPARAWRLQVASLRDSTTALTVGRQAEAASGWPFTVLRSRQGELTWYAVLVGQFASRAEADAARTRLGELDRQLAGAIIREPR